MDLVTREEGISMELVCIIDEDVEIYLHVEIKNVENKTKTMDVIELEQNWRDEKNGDLHVLIS